MSDEINDGGMSVKVSELFNKKVSPDVLDSFCKVASTDPLGDLVERCRRMCIGLDTMLEASMMLNAHALETQVPEIKDQFFANINHLKEMIREGNTMASQQKVDDVVKSFVTYKKVVHGLFGRITNIISEFPKYSSEINSIGVELSKVRSDLMNDRALVITEDDYKRLAFELLSLLSKSTKSRDGEVGGVDKTTEEILDEKKSVVDKIKGRV